MLGLLLAQPYSLTALVVHPDGLVDMALKDLHQFLQGLVAVLLQFLQGLSLSVSPKDCCNQFAVERAHAMCIVFQLKVRSILS